MTTQGSALGWYVSTIYNSQLGGFEPVYSTYRINRLLGAGRQTSYPCWVLPLSPGHIVSSILHRRCVLFNLNQFTKWLISGATPNHNLSFSFHCPPLLYPYYNTRLPSCQVFFLRDDLRKPAFTVRFERAAASVLL